MNTKIHAKEYLSEFSIDKAEWLKVLITEAIETNGAIAEDRKNVIFDCLLNNTQPQPKSSHQTITEQMTSKLIFESLTHKRGVNALCENQTIKFSPDVTILYGLNGSGKSSYFRILNNISGGTQKKIFPNIYAADTDKKTLDVSVKYKFGNKDRVYNCNDSLIEQTDFHGVKVFDSSYLSGLLQPKSPDETFVYPLGLHLFGYIAQILDAYTKKLSQLAEIEKLKLPAITINDFSDNIRSKFNNRQDFKDSERNDIKTKYIFSDADKNDLIKKESNLQQLQQTNYQDKITLVTKENSAISSFVEKINEARKYLKDYSDDLKKSFDVYTEAKRKNDETRKQSEILTKISKSDTPEWKAFIKAGQEYSFKLDNEEIQKCPYCHQEIKTTEAINIIKAYANFLNDTSEKELNTAKQKLEAIQKKIKELNVTIVLSNEIKTILTDASDFQSKLDQLISYKNTLQNAKVSENITEMEIDFSYELDVLKKKQKENEDTLTNLKASKDEKDKNVTDLQKDILILKEKKSISEQKTIIDQYFSIFDRINEIEAKKIETRTTELTKLSNQAQNSLLTENLKTNFESELKLLGKNNLQVELDGKSGTKGNFTTQLKLKGNNKVGDIFSEGEQKAVGLAMFFAEIQDENYPIILDDPVTSLDHEIAAKLAQRLLAFENQVIVFCHNKLFLDGFETSKENHVCKTIDSACNDSKGKHIRIYKVEGDGNRKGILTNYKGDNSNALIKEIEKKLCIQPFEDSLSVSILLRRAVEKVIDEDVFKNQLPPKVSNKTSRIQWDIVKKINPYPDLVERLRVIHDIVSSEIHVGSENSDNPITIDRLRDLKSELISIKNKFKNENSSTVGINP